MKKILKGFIQFIIIREIYIIVKEFVKGFYRGLKSEEEGEY